MLAGERAVVTCAPSHAYGEAGGGSVIPPNATLQFDVELVSFENPKHPDRQGAGSRAGGQAQGEL